MNKELLHRYVSDSTGNESNICQIYAINDGKTVYGRPLVDMLLFAAYDQDGKAPDLATLSASRYNGK